MVRAQDTPHGRGQEGNYDQMLMLYRHPQRVKTFLTINMLINVR